MESVLTPYEKAVISKYLSPSANQSFSFAEKMVLLIIDENNNSPIKLEENIRREFLASTHLNEQRVQILLTLLRTEQFSVWTKEGMVRSLIIYFLEENNRNLFKNLNHTKLFEDFISLVKREIDRDRGISAILRGLYYSAMMDSFGKSRECSTCGDCYSTKA